MNKASGGDGIPVELFQILKDDPVKVLHPVYQQIWKTQQWPQDRKRSVFIPIPKKGNAKECSNYRTSIIETCIFCFSSCLAFFNLYNMNQISLNTVNLHDPPIQNLQIHLLTKTNLESQS